MLHNSNPIPEPRDYTGTVSRILDFALRPRSHANDVQEVSVQRVLIIKPCCLGDMLMATPVVRAVSQQLPEASISVATTEWTKPAIETNPRVDQVIRYPPEGTLRSAIRLGWALRSHRYDLGVSLDRSPGCALAMAVAGIPNRLGIDSNGRGIGLSHRVSPQSDQHETELYLSVIESFGFEPSKTHPEYQVPDDAIVSINQLIPDNRERKLVILHPGGAMNPGVAMLEKRWPATNFGELAALLENECNSTVVLVGSETDRDAISTTKDFARAPVIDLCGQLSLPQLAALASRADLYIGNDSGTTHLASAVGTPVVAIFGPTNPQKYRPLGRRTRICATDDSWNISGAIDLRSADRGRLPDIATVPLPTVFNACIELLEGAV
jgi:heptosyltransferase II